MATWPTGYRGVQATRPGPDEEIICLTLDRWSPPSTIIHVPGDGHARRADFGTDTGQSSGLGEALRAAGAVYPSLPDTDEAEVLAYDEEHGARLPEAVFGAVGSYTGLSIDQAAVQAGELPSVLVPTV